MSTFEERIAKAVADKLNDGTVEELVSDAVTKALKSSIEDQFTWKGEARKVIDEKVKEVMAPPIERLCGKTRCSSRRNYQQHKFS